MNFRWKSFSLFENALVSTANSGGETPEEEFSSFEDYATDLSVRIVRIVQGVFVGATLATWPMDLWNVDLWNIQGESAQVRYLQYNRIAYLIPTVLLYLSLRYSVWARKRVAAVFTFFQALMTFGCGYVAGTMGGIESPFFYNVYLTAFASSQIVVPLKTRIASTLIVPAGWLAGFFGFYPEHLEHPLIWGPISYILFTCFLSPVCGHGVYLLVRRNYEQGKLLAQRTRDVAELAGHLEGKVEDQTRELRNLAQHLQDSREEERLRISRELHDELGQQITALRYEIENAKEKSLSGPGAAVPALEDLGRRTEDLLDEVRQIIASMRPGATRPKLSSGSLSLRGSLNHNTSIGAPKSGQTKSAANP